MKRTVAIVSFSGRKGAPFRETRFHLTRNPVKASGAGLPGTQENDEEEF